MAQHHQNALRDRVSELFSDADLNGDGRLDAEELRTLLCTLDPGSSHLTADRFQCLLGKAGLADGQTVEVQKFLSWVFGSEEATPLIQLAEAGAEEKPSDNGEAVELVVTNLGGRTLATLVVEPAWTVAEVKQAIRHQDATDSRIGQLILPSGASGKCGTVESLGLTGPVTLQMVGGKKEMVLELNRSCAASERSHYGVYFSLENISVGEVELTGLMTASRHSNFAVTHSLYAHHAAGRIDWSQEKPSMDWCVGSVEVLETSTPTLLQLDSPISVAPGGTHCFCLHSDDSNGVSYSEPHEASGDDVLRCLPGICCNEDRHDLITSWSEMTPAGSVLYRAYLA